MYNIEEVINQVEQLFKDDASGHDIWHTMRVYKTAILIAEKEVCNKEVVILGALLHDVDDKKLFHTENYSNARHIMEEIGIGSGLAEEVIETIRTVSYKGTDTEMPRTIEGKIVQDADRLDALGAIGVARAFAYGGNKGRSMYDPKIEPRREITEKTYRENNGTTVNHFYEKLFLLKDLMNTEAAKEIAIERDRFMHTFIDEFLKEWG